LALSLPRELLTNGNTRIVQNYGNLELEHAEPIHFHVETKSGKPIAKIKEDGKITPNHGDLNKEAKELLSQKKNISKLRKAEKKLPSTFVPLAECVEASHSNRAAVVNQKNEANVEHLDSLSFQFESDPKVLAGEILSSIDDQRYEWNDNLKSAALRRFLAIHLDNASKISELVEFFPHDLRTFALEMILRNDKASIDQLNGLVSFIPACRACIHGRIAEIIFLIRSKYLQQKMPKEKLTANSLFPIPPSYDFHTALYVAKLFFERGQLPESEYFGIQSNFERFLEEKKNPDCSEEVGD
jgi:hypothetical protein